LEKSIGILKTRKSISIDELTVDLIMQKLDQDLIWQMFATEPKEQINEIENMRFAQEDHSGHETRPYQPG